MSEPYWVALGPKASPVDYVGDWAAGTAYLPGQVVRRNGADHIAVNPSTGQEPPGQVVGALPVIGMGLALPSAPFDGQEYILTDSLTAPTYTWRFRYIAAKATNKWVFVGGTGKQVFAAADDTQATANIFQALANRPRFVVPVAGLFNVRFGACGASPSAGGTTLYGGVSVNAANPVRAMGINVAAGVEFSVNGEEQVSAGAGASIDLMHFTTAATATWRSDAFGRGRYIEVTPIAVGG